MRIAVVGLGSMGKRRVRGLQRLGVTDICGADSRDDRRKETESTYGIRTYGAIDEALDAARPDAVVVSLPPHLHCAGLDAALARRLPVFVEASVVDTRLAEIESEARRRGVLVAPSATLLFHPAVETVARLLNNGGVGTLSNMVLHSGQYLPDWHRYESVDQFYVSRRDTGGAREIVPFELTWLTRLLGFPRRVCGNVRKTISIVGAETIDDTYNCVLDCRERLAVMTVDVVSRSATRRLLVNGSAGQVVWDWNAETVDTYSAATGTWNREPYSAGRAAPLYDKRIGEEMYVKELSAFLGAVRRESQFPNTLRADRRVLDVLYAIERADREGRYVSLPRRTGLLVTARASSSRLPGKHFLDIHGKCVIEHLLDRLRSAFSSQIASGEIALIIAAPDEAQSRAFERFVREDCDVFYGAGENIPLRHYEAAAAHGLDNVVALDGDDIFVSVGGIKEVIRALDGGEEYVTTAGLPLGMNPFGYTRTALQRCLAGHWKDSLDTGWAFIFGGLGCRNIELGKMTTVRPLRFTLDYPEDYEFTKRLVGVLGERLATIEDRELVDRVISEGLDAINAGVSEAYWSNFNQQRDAQRARASAGGLAGPDAMDVN